MHQWPASGIFALAAVVAACSSSVPNDAPHPDAAPAVIIDGAPGQPDATTEVCAGGDLGILASYGALGTVVPQYMEDHDPSDPARDLSIWLPLNADPVPDVLLLYLNKLAMPFGTGFPASQSFLFSPGSPCTTSDKACAYLYPDTTYPVLQPYFYTLDGGLLELGFGAAPSPPGGACRAHDLDVAACDADSANGCAYFFCSDTCQASATTMCDAGCWQGCQMHGQLTGARLRDGLGNCTTIDSIGF